MNLLPESELLETAIRAARTAGAMAANAGPRRREVDATSRFDMKLAMDAACQRELERILQDAFPDHAILGEEGDINRQADYEWIVDPIDGTLNYFHGLPIWGCSVAVRRTDTREVVAGCVYLPAADECFAASATGPATLNGAPIQVSSTPAIGQAMMLFGLGKPDPRDGYETVRLNRILQGAQKTRVHGAAAPDICYVACGRADGYIDEGVFIWDYAAAALIATRAGARFDILRNYPDGREQCLVTNGHIHEQVRDLCFPA